MDTDSPSQLSVSKKDLFSCLFFIFIWIIPITYTNLVNKDIPFFPRTLCYVQRISFLFTKAIWRWPVYYVLIRYENTPGWTILPEDEYFHLQPFGFRTRFDQLMTFSHYNTGWSPGVKSKKARERELAHWLARNYAQRHKDQPAVEAVQFVAAVFKVEDKPTFKGHWQKPSLNSFTKDQILIVSTHTINK